MAKTRGHGITTDLSVTSRCCLRALRARLLGLKELLARHDIHHVLSHYAIASRARLPFQERAADLLDCPLRAQITFADDEHYSIGKSKGMLQHQLLQLPVILSAPELAREERPADFHFAGGRLQIPIARTADDASGFPLDDRECTFGFDGAGKELRKDLAFVAIALRMLLPNPRIAGRGKQRIEVLWTKRPEFKQFTKQRRLKIKFQVGHPWEKRTRGSRK